MKRNYLTLSAILLLICSSCYKVNQLEGTWELVSAQWIFEDTTEFPNSEYDREIKMIGKTNFLVIRQDTTNDELFFSGGGTYVLDGDSYTESLEFASWVTDIGSTLTYECSYEDSLWVITGPVTEEGGESPGWKLTEKWKKIE